MKRVKRHPSFELALEITNEDFLRPPREYQRSWLVNRALKEAADDLIRLDGLAGTFIPGAGKGDFEDRTNRPLTDQEIMEDWQIPVMEAMAEIVSEQPGSVLEIGFGRGISASLIQERMPATHTIVECNEHVIERFEEWRTGYPERDIRLIEGRWQDVTDSFDLYDGVFFHAYPLNSEEFVENVVQTVTFAEPFFAVASRHLRKGGVFTYLSNEYDSISRGHQIALLSCFQRFTISKLGPLDIPSDSEDALWGDSIILVEAVR